jgi:hypothetical protein
MITKVIDAGANSNSATSRNWVGKYPEKVEGHMTRRGARRPDEWVGGV